MLSFTLYGGAAATSLLLCLYLLLSKVNVVAPGPTSISCPPSSSMCCRSTLSLPYI